MGDENPKFPVSNGLLEPRHVDAIGSAIWVYLCLIDWQDCDDGKVNNGNPVTLAKISARLGCNDRTARRGLERLQSEGYINSVKREQGWEITITKPKKRLRHVTKVSKPPDRNVNDGQNCHSDLTKVSRVLDSSLPLREGRTLKEETQKKEQDRAREDSISGIFKELEAGHPKGHNPDPDAACRAFLSRFDTPEQAQECLRQHREMWQPVWRAGQRIPKDLHNWIMSWKANADIGLRAQPAPQQGDAGPSYLDVVKQAIDAKKNGG